MKAPQIVLQTSLPADYNHGVRVMPARRFYGHDYATMAPEANPMRKQLPGWSEDQRKAAERQRRMWQEFFSASKQRETEPAAGLATDEAAAKVSAVMARHETELLAYPNVVGVAPGVRTAKGKVTGEPCLVVYVSRKVSRNRLKKGEALPRRIEGIPVDVVETQEIRPQLR
jgi:hypothetical protein